MVAPATPSIPAASLSRSIAIAIQTGCSSSTIRVQDSIPWCARPASIGTTATTTASTGTIGSGAITTGGPGSTIVMSRRGSGSGMITRRAAWCPSTSTTAGTIGVPVTAPPTGSPMIGGGTTPIGRDPSTARGSRGQIQGGPGNPTAVSSSGCRCPSRSLGSQARMVGSRHPFLESGASSSGSVDEPA